MAKALFPLIFLIGTVIAHPLVAQDVELMDREFDFAPQLLDLFLALSIFTLYFVPTIIAHIRDVQAYAKIFFVNLLLGWTVVGWIVVLIWSVRAKPFFGRRPFSIVLIISAVCVVGVLFTAYLQYSP